MNVDAGRARYRPPEWDATIARVESYTGDRAAIVAVTTSDGIVGYGQLGSKDATGAAHDMLWHHCVPAVIGQPCRDPFALVERMLLRFRLNYKRFGVAFNGAVAGIDAAVWDAVGKKAGLPVCELFKGGYARPMDIYASSISRTVDPSRLAAALHQLHRTFAISRFKVKIGTRMGATARDDKGPERTFSAIESAFDMSSGPRDIRVAVDANGAYDDASIAAEVVHGLSQRPCMQKSGAFWFAEEPVPWMNYEDCRKFRRMLASRSADAPIVNVAGGEQEFRLDVWSRLLLTRSGNGEDDEVGLPFMLVQPDMGYCGGFSVAMVIAELAACAMIKVAPHSPQPDFHTIVAHHMLCSGVASAFECIEVACVDDGLAQMVFKETSQSPEAAQEPFVGEAKGPAFFGPKFRFRINRQGQLLFPGQATRNANATPGWGVTVDEQWMKYVATRRSSDEAEQWVQWKRATKLRFWGMMIGISALVAVGFSSTHCLWWIFLVVGAVTTGAFLVSWLSFRDALARDLTAAHEVASGAATLWKKLFLVERSAAPTKDPDPDACLRA